MDAEPRESEVRDLLEHFAPNLLCESKFSRFVTNLFASECGKWLEVEELCRDVPSAHSAIARLNDLTRTPLYVCWLGHPGAAGGYAFVQFYLEEFFWTKSAIYNLTFARSAVERGNGESE